MTNLQEITIKQLQEQHSKAKSKYSMKAKVMATSTLEAITEFCRQSEAFAEAVHDNPKTFCDCMESIAKSVGNSISDLDAYKKAVKFYMPKAEINLTMTIITSEKEKGKLKAMNLNLLELL